MAMCISWTVIFWGSLILVAINISETLHSSVIKTEAFKDHVSNRRKREVTCADKYATITTGHTACLQPSSIVKDKGVSDTDKNVIVDIHNTARREVSPTARNMMLMSWDDEIANTAQRWAENCVIDHDGGYKRYAYGRFSVGQNLSWGYKKTWQKAIQQWIDEKTDYVFGGSNANVVGHYTQMVWAESIKIGCGYAQCGSTHYYVCDYGPGGNMGNTVPYKRGTTCGDCASNCKNGLCDCNNKVCLNGGDLNLNTCACSCTKNLQFYLQPDCRLNCTGIQDPSQCSNYSSTFKGGCTKYTNVPQECPSMCKWCPTAGAGYTTVSGASRLAATATTICVIMLSFWIGILW